MSHVLSTKRSRVRFVVGLPVACIIVWAALGAKYLYLDVYSVEYNSMLIEVSAMGITLLVVVIIVAVIAGIVFAIDSWIERGE